VDEGEDAAPEDGVEAGVGGEVGPHAPVVQDEDEDRAPEEFEGADGEQKRGLGALRPAVAEDGAESRREEQVEVLFDGEGPDDGEAGGREGGPADDVDVVVDVGDYGEDAARVAGVEMQRGRDEYDERGDDIQRDEDAERAAEVEVAEPERAGGGELAAQQRGDEVAGEEEKDGDAERGGDVIRDAG
jgi:hypothetical protein